MSIMMKKGISKEYEVESLILNEENVDKLYGNFLKDLKSKIEFCFANEKVLYFLINGEKINGLNGEKANNEIIEKFKRDKFLDIHLIFQETFCQRKQEKIIRKNYNWFFNENDIFINDPIKNITDANHIENRNNYSFLYTGKDFNSNITYPVYEYDFQHNYYIKDNKVFSKENSLNFEYLKLDSITNLYYYLDNFLRIKKWLIDFVFFSANQKKIEEINKKSKGDLLLKELLIFEDFYKIGKCQNFTQIFGHRTNDTTEHSINLEGQVEFGGYLMYLVLTKNGREIKQIKNDVYDKDYFIKERLNYKQDTTNLTANEEVNKLIISRLVKVKPCKPNLLSLNFGENVFKKKIWNEVTIKARGLFVDKDSGEVKIRSYDKAFNYEERKETRDEELSKNLVFPMIAKVKENGFLGLISVIDDEIVLATKSTTSGDWKNFFQKLWDREKEEVKEYLKKFIKKENCTLIFEVKSFNDKHIIDFETEELVLLDVVKNTLNLNGKNIDTNYSQEKIVELANVFEKKKPTMIRIVETKQIINDFNEFKEFIKENKYKEIEGFMFTDNTGFIFKWKTEYYNRWKRVRNCYYYYINNTNDSFPFRKCEDSFEIGFMKWLTAQDLDWVLKNHFVDIIETFKKNVII